MVKNYPRGPEWLYTVARPVRPRLLLQILDPTLESWGVAEESAYPNNKQGVPWSAGITQNGGLKPALRRSRDFQFSVVRLGFGAFAAAHGGDAAEAHKHQRRRRRKRYV